MSQIPKGAGREFSSPALALFADSQSVSIPPMLPQWHIEDPGHSAKSAGGSLHLNMLTCFTQWS